MQEESRHVPAADQVGILTSAVLLVYVLTKIISAPQFTLSLQIPGFYFAFPLTLGTVMTFLAAGLTATGMDWLVRSHPALGHQRTIEHWMLPTTTSFVIGITLAILPNNSIWWIAFGASAILMVFVFLAEYAVVDPAAPNYAIARAGLTALSYALFLILITALRFTGARLVFVIPALFLTSSLIALRILHLDGSDRWDFPWAAGIGLICTQIGAGLHYWPLTALQFGLAVTGLLYALTAFSTNVTEGVPIQRAALEPGIILTLAWGTVIFLR
ncbi:MAG TPA: hypothetical protein VMT73_11230 [Anaerolineales bacterium]|nr:hypothetical protein [Anaerolineales bacterium]